MRLRLRNCWKTIYDARDKRNQPGTCPGWLLSLINSMLCYGVRPRSARATIATTNRIRKMTKRVLNDKFWFIFVFEYFTLCPVWNPYLKRL